MTDPGRFAIALAAAALGFLTVWTTGTRDAPARGARRLEIVDLITQQNGRVRSLGLEVSALRRQLDEVAAGLEGRGADVRALRADIRRASRIVGTAGLEGPGVTVLLDDSPMRRSPSGDPNDLVVHERDIQTVVNALWAAGAEAVAIEGERLTSLSAVRCAGNTLLLHGALRSPPYEISAIGDAAALSDALEDRPGVRQLRDAAATFGLRLRVGAGEVRMRPASAAPVLEEGAPA